MSRKTNIWRIVSITLGILLAASVFVNISGLFQVPQQMTLFMTGALISIGVGYSILNPDASLSRLDATEESRFRGREFAVACVTSILLGLTMIVEEVRNSPLIWLFLPIIALPGFLWVRKYQRRPRR